MAQPPVNSESGGEYFVIVEKMPAFQGGNLSGFRNWVQERTVYPERIKDKKVKGQVVVSFIVEADGSVSYVNILQGDDQRLVEKARRILAQSPRWEPGRQRGCAERVMFTLPINFELPEDEIDTFGEEDFTPVEEFAAEDEPKHDYVMMAEQMPSFDGGDVMTFQKWVSANVVYPLNLMAKRIDGMVVVSFIVGKDGNLSNVKALSGPHDELVAEVLYTVRNSPRWEPGRQDGEPVAVFMSIPVKFDLSNVSDKKLAETVASRKNMITYMINKPSEEGASKAYVGLVDEKGEIILGENEVLPVFMKGSVMEFREWVMRRIQYPSIAMQMEIQGVVVVDFIVEKDGSVNDIKIFWSADPLLDKEVMRVLSSSPKWKQPGLMEGVPVRVKFRIPVNFVMAN